MSNIRGYSNSLATAYGVATFQTGTSAPKTHRCKAATPIRNAVRLALHRLTARMSNLVKARARQNEMGSYLEDTDLEKTDPGAKPDVPFQPALAA